jgi:hypothetical protein
MVVPALIFAADKFVCETAAIVCVPVKYVPDSIVCADVLALYVAAALVVTEAVKLTEELPAVPAEMYPAVVTLGVTETVFVSVRVLVPVDTVAVVTLIEDGAVTEPFGVALIK